MPKGGRGYREPLLGLAWLLFGTPLFILSMLIWYVAVLTIDPWLVLGGAAVGLGVCGWMLRGPWRARNTHLAARIVAVFFTVQLVVVIAIELTVL